jgi:hypothetical protein
MNDKERFDACMQQATYGAGRHDGRREYEWKVTLGLWGLIVGATVYREKWAGPVPFLGMLLIGVGILVVYAIFWLYPLWRANQNDQAIASHFRLEGAKILQNPSHIPVDLDRKRIDVSVSGFLSDWSMQFQLFATTCLIAIFLTAGYRK